MQILEPTPTASASPVYGGFWIRVWASLVDSVLITMLLTPVLTLVLGGDSPLQRYLNIFFSWFFPAIVVVVFWIYKSATPGKIVTFLKIVDAKNLTPASTKQLVIRYLSYYISLLPFALGFFWVAFDSRKQGWHDKLAGTVVIRDESAPQARKDRSFYLKGIIGLTVVVAFFGAVAVGYGIWWGLKNKDIFMKEIREVYTEGRVFGKNKANQACVDESLKRHRDCEGFLCHVKNNLFLTECLKTSTPDKSFCEKVPPKGEILQSSLWRVQQCDRYELTEDRYCHQLFGAVQGYCEEAKAFMP